MAEKLVFKIEAINKKFREAVDDSIKRTENLQANVESITTKAGIAFAGLSASVGLFVNEAAKIETINTQFQVLTGSVLGAEKAVGQLQELSASTPFAFEEVAAAGKQLLGFGFEVESLGENLRNLGDVAAASGAPLTDLSLIFGQVRAAGKLTGERLLQLQERAIPIGPAIAQTLGVTENAVRDLVSQGKVDFATFEEAFRSLSAEGGFAFGGLDKQSQTLEGQISTLKDNFSLLAAEIGRQLLPVAKDLTTALIGVFQQLRQSPELVATIAQFLKIATVATGLITVVGGLTLAVLKFKAVLAGLSAFAAGLGAVLTAPFTLTVAAIAGLVGVVGSLAAAWDSNLSVVENITVNFAGRLKSLFSGIGTLLRGAFTLDTQAIKDGLSEIEIAFKESGTNIEEARQEFEEQQLERQQREIEAERLRQEALIAEEQAANQRKLENQKELEKQQRDLQLQQAQREAEIQAEIDELKLQTAGQINAQETNLLKEAAQERQAARENERKTEIKNLIKQLEEKKALEEKYGKEFVEFQEFVQSENFRNAAQASSQLVALRSSENATLNQIGKAAAVTQIGIDTARGAVAAYQALAGIPFIGPGLGIAAAAALITFGAEQTRRVLTAQTGGLVEGIGRGDRVSALLEPGELVVPRQNFEDVINAETSRRISEEGLQPTGSGGGQGSINEIVISFAENAFELIEAKLAERTRLGVAIS